MTGISRTFQEAVARSASQGVSSTGANASITEQSAITLNGSSQYSTNVAATFALTRQSAASSGSITQGTYTYARPNAQGNSYAGVFQTAYTDGATNPHAHISQQSSIDPNISQTVQTARNDARFGTVSQGSYTANYNGPASTQQAALASAGLSQSAIINNSNGTSTSINQAGLNTTMGTLAQNATANGGNDVRIAQSGVNLAGDIRQVANATVTG